MAWAWLCSYIFIVVMILKVNDALNMARFSEFVKKFKNLVDEMSFYFEPCGFPIELVERCQTQRDNVGRDIRRLAEQFTQDDK